MPPSNVGTLSLEEAIDELLGILRQASTLEICSRVSLIWLKQARDAATDTGLSSPQRQTFYLLGLMMNTPEPESDDSLPSGSWERILVLLNTITDSYVHSAMKAVVIDGADPKKAQVSSVAFIQRFMSGRLAVAEQLERIVLGLCAPFDDVIRCVTGISATEALEVVTWMRDTLTAQWDDGFQNMAAAKAKQVETVENLFSGPEPYEEKLKAWQDSPDFESVRAVFEKVFEFTKYPNCLSIEQFVERFGKDRTDAFLKTFALRRGSAEGFRYFASPKPPNPAELAPLFIVENDRVCAPLHGMLYNALYDVFDEILRGREPVKDKYLKGRSDYLEQRANSLISSLFPDAAIVVNKYFETPRAQNEHDGLILAGRSLLVLEEKSSEMKTPSRDVERCFRNLTDHFKSNRGIQHAYDQANRVVALVENASDAVRFYDERGTVIARIEPGTVEEIFSICVTLESFGVLAVDLTELLDVSAGKPYPLVMNLYDLETLIDGFQRKGLTGDDFLRYLRQRRKLQGRLVSDDELNLAGKFIVDGRLPDVPKDTFMFVNDYSNVFDDLFYEKHGVKSNLMGGAVPGGVQMDLRGSLRAGKPVFVGNSNTPQTKARKVGRNEPCPCGSAKKYKKCCGSA